MNKSKKQPQTEQIKVVKVKPAIQDYWWLFVIAACAVIICFSFWLGSNEKISYQQYLSDITPEERTDIIIKEELKEIEDDKQRRKNSEALVDSLTGNYYSFMWLLASFVFGFIFANNGRRWF